MRVEIGKLYYLRVFLGRQRGRADDGAFRPDRGRVGVQPAATAAPRGRPAAGPATVARLPLLPLTPAAVDALSRGERDGVLAVPLLATTLKFVCSFTRIACLVTR